MRVELVLLVCCLGLASATAPPDPKWPKEVTMTYASDDFQFHLNYSYASQKMYVSYAWDATGSRQAYLSCNEDTLDIYDGDSTIGEVCYEESAEDFDPFLCPLPDNPFGYLIGTNMSYNGQTSFENQQVYVWMNGYDDYRQECISCTFYWETAVYSTEFRTAIAADFDVVNLDYPPTAGFFQNFFTPLLANSRAVQPVSAPSDLPCHTRVPPLFLPNTRKAQVEPTETTGNPFFHLMQKLKGRK